MYFLSGAFTGFKFNWWYFAASKIQVLNTSTIKCWGDFRSFKKNCRKFSRNLCILRRQWPRQTSAFSQMLRVNIPKLYCLLITHLNEWNGRLYFSLWSPGFSFFVWPCYSRRTHPRYSIMKIKVSNSNWVITKNQLKRCLWKKKW